MTKQQKKDLTVLAILMAVIPIVFFTIGIINLLFLDNLEQAKGFLISGGVITAILLGLFILQYLSIRRQNAVLKDSQKYLAQVTDLSILDGVLQVNAAYTHDNIEYHFGAVYGVTTEDMDTQIMSQFNDGRLQQIEVRMNLSQPKYFSIDVNKWLSAHGINANLDQLVTTFDKKKIQ